ncbi:hypothetical protein SAMN05216257_104375 [Meinhardsimonia xiamenensis]|jgi:flagellar biosynthesis/type III secretory pathway chaperone|uniref:FlgN protein n=1 Tax=Meinhardsimonia xiamenensis TaxID=990712 RepID=A0A1G9EMD8_9RHOB|nr:hypothetical protein [Meinhardsimonia xiamenensis]PRX33709.1 hypothetical protein LV81_02139 [Meinhardsimonia xiamenensis]SDK77243.1 hypothetical protein SAMN05216257_104375 [Meinhardsimonia xiamenensis]
MSRATAPDKEPLGLASEIEDLLERERRALLEARFDVLERLAARKESLLRELAEHRPKAGDLERLQALSRRNEGLFRAALAGIGRARERARAIAGAGEFRTYGRDGRMQSAMPPAVGQPARRA